MQNVLILSAGRRVELVSAFIAELRQALPGTHLFAADAEPEMAPACHKADKALRVPKVSEPGYSDDLLKLCLDHGIGLVIPTIDTELLTLAAQRERFATQGIHLVVSDTELVVTCRDKRRLASYFEVQGWRIPKLYELHDLHFPCFVKPYDGSNSVGAQALISPSELSEAMVADPSLLFMEFIGKEYAEYTVDTYYDRTGKLLCLVPRQRLAVRGGEVSKGVTRKGELYCQLKHELKKISGAVGCVTIQLFFNGNDFIMSEINPRFGGGYPLSYSAGANYPGWLLAEYLQAKQLSEFDSWEADLLMLRYDQQVLIRAN